MEREAALRSASPNEKTIAAHAASMIQHNIGKFGLQYKNAFIFLSSKPRHYHFGIW